MFCLAWVTALAITISVFPFVPAVGGYLHHHIAQSQTYVLVRAAWTHEMVLTPARDGSLRVLSAKILEGIVTFPSFHAAAAVLLTWGFWQIRPVRWFAVLLNGAMLASAPFIGGHYLIDVVFGCIVAVAAIRVTRRVHHKEMTGHPERCGAASGAGDMRRVT